MACSTPCEFLKRYSRPCQASNTSPEVKSTTDRTRNCLQESRLKLGPSRAPRVARSASWKALRCRSTDHVGSCTRERFSSSSSGAHSPFSSSAVASPGPPPSGGALYFVVIRLPRSIHRRNQKPPYYHAGQHRVTAQAVAPRQGMAGAASSSSQAEASDSDGSRSVPDARGLG